MTTTLTTAQIITAHKALTGIATNSFPITVSFRLASLERKLRPYSELATKSMNDLLMKHATTESGETLVGVPNGTKFVFPEGAQEKYNQEVNELLGLTEALEHSMLTEEMFSGAGTLTPAFITALEWAFEKPSEV